MNPGLELAAAAVVATGVLSLALLVIRLRPWRAALRWRQLGRGNPARSRLGWTPGSRPISGQAAAAGRGGPWGGLPKGFLLSLGLLAGVVLLAAGAGFPSAAGPVILILALGWPEIQARRYRLRLRVAKEKQLPLLVELLSLCTAGGMSLTEAFHAAAPLVEEPLGADLREVSKGIYLGRAMETALGDLVGRCDSPAVSRFATSLVRGLRLGSPQAEILTSQVRVARKLERYRLESRINALPLKLTLCSTFLFFPPIAVMVILPNLLALLEAPW